MVDSLVLDFFLFVFVFVLFVMTGRLGGCCRAVPRLIRSVGKFTRKEEITPRRTKPFICDGTDGTMPFICFKGRNEGQVIGFISPMCCVHKAKLFHLTQNNKPLDLLPVFSTHLATMPNAAGP
jgi:hypothetical protein